MKIFALCAGVMLYAIAAMGWQFLATTTWNGSVNVEDTTQFTPSSTTAYVTMSAPAVSPCPEHSQDPPFDFDYNAVAKLSNGTDTFTAQHRCGGCSYTGAVTVTTNQVWTVSASIHQVQGSQTSAQGPVKAYAANPQVNCSGS